MAFAVTLHGPSLASLLRRGMLEEEDGPVAFYCQHPPTLRLQPGRSKPVPQILPIPSQNRSSCVAELRCASMS